MSSSNPSQLRRPGRPANVQGLSDQRGKLLDSATELFSRQGIAATPLNSIAKHAGATTAMVHYYFKSRDQLLDAIVEERLMPLIRRFAVPALEGDRPADDMLIDLCKRIFDLAAEAPWWPVLWVREIVSEGGLLRERLITRVRALAEKFMERIAIGQSQGCINRDLDPLLTFVSLLGLTMFPLAAENIWRKFALPRRVDATTLARHTVAFLSSGIRVQRGAS